MAPLAIAPDDKFRSVFYRRSLFHFAEKGNIAKMKELLDRSEHAASVNDKLEGFTALLAAANADQHEVVQFVLNRGAQVDEECGARILSEVPNTAICQAAHAGFADTVAVLLNHGANMTGAMTTAASGGHARVIALLASAGADIDEEIEVPSKVVTHIRRKDSSMLTAEITPVSTDVTNSWPLLLVVTPPPANLRVFETASLLIQCGANPNLERPECTDEHPGRTVLQVVVARYFRKAVEKMNNSDHSPPRRILLAISVLVANGADIDARYCTVHGGESVRKLAETDPCLNAVVQSSLQYHADKRLVFTQMLMKFVSAEVFGSYNSDSKKSEAKKHSAWNRVRASVRASRRLTSNSCRDEFQMAEAIGDIVAYLPGVTDVMVGRLQKNELVESTVPENYLQMKRKDVDRARGASRWPIDVEAFMLKRQSQVRV